MRRSALEFDRAAYLRNSGQVAPAQAQLDKAGMLLRAVLTTDPSNIRAHGLLADALFSSQSFEEAAVHYKAYLQFQPNDTAALAAANVSASFGSGMHSRFFGSANSPLMEQSLINNSSRAAFGNRSSSLNGRRQHGTAARMGAYEADAFGGQNSPR